ncbi:hypothetical protein H9Q69_013256 [Fusarium xylarioides]|nr:hypothetical protein H9Q69_013256 [Fusarium xylarioides]
MYTLLSGALRTPYLPEKIDRLAIAPNTNFDGVAEEIKFCVNTFFTEITPKTLRGDVQIISSDAANEILRETRDDKHSTAQKEWFDDTEELIKEYKRKYPEQDDLKLIHAVAENLVDVMTSDTQLFEVMLVDNLLRNLDTEGRALQPLNRIAADLFQNLSPQHPLLNILKIGAGTGGTTNSVLNPIGDTYGRYTYTDISAGFFKVGFKIPSP